MPLRDYQSDICARVSEAFAKCRSVMVQMPTGTGKTVVLAELVKRLMMKDEGLKILIVAHRRELIEQIKATIKRMELNANNHSSFINNQTITVESIQTISRRMATIEFSPSVVVIDEAHHALAKTYKMMWEAWPEAKFLGLTATPCRLNGKGFTDLFDVLLSSLSVPEFIKKGVLAPFDYVTINEGGSQQRLIDSLMKRGADGDYQVKEMNEVLNKRPSIEQLFNCYTQFAKKKKGIVYAVSIEHARSIAEYYESKGIKTAAISAKTPVKEREEWLESFKAPLPPSGGYCHADALTSHRGADGLQVLVNVDIFSEGFDCPDVEFIQLARPTLSLAKYLQMVGRGLRPHKNKECCVILDNVGLVRLFGLPTRCWDWNQWFVGNSPRITARKKTAAVSKGSSSPLQNAFLTANSDSEFSLVVAHEQLEQLIKDAKLEEWSDQMGIIEEEAEAFQDEDSGLWGLRRGGKVLVGPSFLRVFDIKEGLVAVRLSDTKLAVVELSGSIVRKLGKGSSVELCNKDFVKVYENKYHDYIDLLSGQRYETLPEVISREGLQLLKTVHDGLMLRLKDPFVYGNIDEGRYFAPIRDWGYFYEVSLSKYKADIERYAVDTDTVIIFKGDNERAYWLYDVHEDGSLDVIDRQSNAYHVTPDGTREKLNRCDILERSMSVLKEIANQYKASGGNPDDNFDKMRFRNRVLHNRLADKMKAMKQKEE